TKGAARRLYGRFDPAKELGDDGGPRARKPMSKGAAPKPALVPQEPSETLVHYSRTPGLKQLDPSKMGTSGVGGAQYKRGVPENRSTFFYTADSEPEDIVTQGSTVKYTVQVHPSHIYDLGKDPEHLVAEMRQR